MAFRTVSEATKAIKDTIAKKPLTEEKARELWANLFSVNLMNHGDLLYEFFLACPVQITTYQAPAVLGYLQKSGTGFDKVLDYISPEFLLRSYKDFEIPPEKLTPVILKDLSNISWVASHPELYTEALSEPLLKYVEDGGRDPYGNVTRDLLRKLPNFWDANRERLIKHLVGKFTPEEVTKVLKECSGIMTAVEKSAVLNQALAKITLPNQHQALRSLYQLAGEYLTIEDRDQFRALVKSKLEELLTVEKTRDPLESFLEGEMRWEETVFAKLYPEEYRKMLAATSHGDDRMGMFPGLPHYRTMRMMFGIRPWD